MVEGEATNGGTCTYLSPGTVRVQRQQFDVSGCVAEQFVKDIVVADGAVEAELSVTKGCGGMWIRTGTRGLLRRGVRERHGRAAQARRRRARHREPDVTDPAAHEPRSGSCWVCWPAAAR